MNVYDFDDTIFKGDSTRDFYWFCLTRHPGLCVCLPRQAWAFVRYALGGLKKRRMKEIFFCFLPRLTDVDAELAAYWDSRQGRIRAWYLAQKHPHDVIISASPDFLLEEAGRRLGVHRVIATRMDKKTGAITGENCRGPEKVTRFAAEYPDAVVEGFYSDHESDEPMARQAQRAYLVQGDKVTDWPLGSA